MARTDPEVTVMVANYNTARYLGHCLKSLMAQTFRDFEVLIVDDGSTDASLDICEQFVREDSRVRLLRLERNRGLTYARHVALPQARGDLVAILDADDVAAPRRLERQVDSFRRNPKTVLLGSYYGIMDSAGKVKRKRKRVPCTDAEIRWWLTFGNCLIHPTIMYRRAEALACGGYDLAILRGEDIELHSKLIALGRAEALPEVLAYWRSHPQSMTKTYVVRELENYYIQVVQRAIERHAHRSVDFDVAGAVFYNTKRPAASLPAFIEATAVLLDVFQVYSGRRDEIVRGRLMACCVKHLLRMRARNSREVWWEEGKTVWNEALARVLNAGGSLLSLPAGLLWRTWWPVISQRPSVRRWPAGKNREGRT